jgi:hypothetical protein
MTTTETQKWSFGVFALHNFWTQRQEMTLTFLATMGFGEGAPT